MILIGFTENLQNKFHSASFDLTWREIEILECFMNNDPFETIAGEFSTDDLSVSEKNVKDFLDQVCQKFGVGAESKAGARKKSDMAKQSLLIAHIFNHYQDGISVQDKDNELDGVRKGYISTPEHLMKVTNCLMETGEGPEVISETTGTAKNSAAAYLNQVYQQLRVHGRREAVIALNAMRIKTPEIFESVTSI